MSKIELIVMAVISLSRMIFLGETMSNLELTVMVSVQCPCVRAREVGCYVKN